VDEDPLPAGMAALWRRGERARRPGRRPTLSLKGIAAAGIELADTEGLAGVSMARVADRLGVTSMALYRYVTNKDELLLLMADTAMAAPPRTVDAPGGWRERLESWCRAQLALIAQHPWVVELTGLPPIGPNRVMWVEAGLAALEDTPLPHGLRVEVIGFLSLHVLTEGQVIAAYAAQQAGRPADHPAMADWPVLLGKVVDPERHPRIAEALATGAFGEGGDEDPTEDQELALTVLLDGIAALIARHGSGG
jgi:AcrR family transcriptional regulator